MKIGRFSELQILGIQIRRLQEAMHIWLHHLFIKQQIRLVI